MKFTLPEDIKALSAAEVRDLIAAARAEATEINAIADEDFSDENLADLEALVAFIAEAETVATEAEATAEDRAARVAAARAAATETPAEDPEVPAEEVVEEKEPAVVAAGAPAVRKPVTSRAAAAAPKPTVEEEPRPVAKITAAADLRAFSTGAAMADLDEVVQGAIERFEAMPKHKVGNSRQRYGVASIKKARTDGFSVENADYRTFQDLVQAASKESRLSGGSLTAAGGWCSPSETLYDLCTIESTDGLWDLPEVQASRGGLSFTKGPSFQDIYDLGGFLQTEAQAEAGTTKDCWDVECPPFQEVRLDAIGLCIRAGILTNSTYPELIRRYLEGAIIAQQHRVTADLITRAQTITGAAVSVADVFQNAVSLLSALELVAEGERQRWRLPFSATLEVVLPRWVRAAIRADLANRTGVDLTNVTDQVIDAHFATRGLRVQFIYNYQPLTIRTGAGTSGSPYVSVPATDYPDTVEALMYPAGTFVKLTNDVINLDAVYDSTGLSTNTYTALFAEEGIALANTCFEARRVSIPFAVSGLTGAAIINQDFGQAGPLNTTINTFTATP